MARAKFGGFHVRDETSVYLRGGRRYVDSSHVANQSTGTSRHFLLAVFRERPS
jgi:hypothetical protein